MLLFPTTSNSLLFKSVGRKHIEKLYVNLNDDNQLRSSNIEEQDL
jgi:hypothetical protein